MLYRTAIVHFTILYDTIRYYTTTLYAIDYATFYLCYLIPEVPHLGTLHLHDLGACVLVALKQPSNVADGYSQRLQFLFSAEFEASSTRFYHLHGYLTYETTSILFGGPTVL